MLVTRVQTNVRVAIGLSSNLLCTPTEHPKPLEVRNVEVSWNLAVDELAESLRNLEKPRFLKGKAFGDSAMKD
jgi:hypothetical protein